MNKIGIIQGRLSPPMPGRLQVFPWSSWDQEFHLARACGFDAIEWLFEADGYEHNPIWTEAGLDSIRHQITTTGVALRSLCADYFMLHPFFRVSEKECRHSVAVLEKLIIQGVGVGLQTILLPVLEMAEIRTDEEKVQLLDSLRGPLSLAAAHGVRLALETELPAPEYRALVEQGDHPALGIYYDTGNATAKGYYIVDDVRTLGPYLCGVHIKDRKRGGPSVLLGEGDADFAPFFEVLAEVGYNGPLILQTPFGEDYLGVARKHLKFVKDYMSHRLIRRDSVEKIPR